MKPVALISVMMVVTMKKMRGEFQYNDITDDFRSVIWEYAWIVGEDIGYEERVLVYAYFN